jgi:formylmethanofuran:tetrahydromethanopterin formyltransferase
LELKVNGVPIEDTFCETFTVRIARILVTSVNRKWALESALEA